MRNFYGVLKGILQWNFTLIICPQLRAPFWCFVKNKTSALSSYLLIWYLASTNRIVSNGSIPMGWLPVLEDDGFVLTESSAILKYLAEKVGSPTYPKELTLRARINEIMDWVNTQFYREIAFHVNYQKSSQTKHGLARKKIRASLTGVSKGWFPSSKYLTVGGTCW